MLFPEKCQAIISIFGTVKMKANLAGPKSWRKKQVHFSTRKSLIAQKCLTQKKEKHFHKTASHCTFKKRETFNFGQELTQVGLEHAH